MAGKLAFASPNMVLGAMGVAVFVYLPPYLAGHLGLGLTVVGAVWMTIRLVDIPIDIGISLAMDRTRTRLGRYRPWLLLGAPILALSLYALFMARPGFSRNAFTFWLLIMYLGQSVTYLAQTAWAATIATDYHARSRLFGYIVAGGVVGTLGVLAMQLASTSQVGGVQAMGWLMVILAPLTIALAVATTPERITPNLAAAPFSWRTLWAVVRHPGVVRLFLAQVCATLGPGWMSALYLFFFKVSRGFTTQQATLLLAAYILAQLPGSLLTPVLARRIGKHRTFILATSAYSLGLLLIFVIPNTANVWMTLPLMAWTGAMASAFDLIIRAMLADVADSLRLDQGQERLSLLYAINQLATKIAAAFAIGLTFRMLAALGFNPRDGAANSVAAVANLQFAFLSGPIVFVMLGGACLVGWRLDAAQHAQVRRQLDERDAATPIR